MDEPDDRFSLKTMMLIFSTLPLVPNRPIAEHVTDYAVLPVSASSHSPARWWNTLRLLCCLIVILLVPGSGLGQSSLLKVPKPSTATGSAKTADGQSNASTATPPEPADSLGRDTPYGTVFGFLQAVHVNDLARATQYLDTKLPQNKAEELAQQLNAVLDAGLTSGIDNVSRSPQGSLNDDLRTTREKVGTAKTPAGDLEIFLDHVTRPNQPSIWLFSAETLAQIPNAYAHLAKKADFTQRLPAFLVKIQFLSVPLWRWLMILIFIALAILLSSVITRSLLRFCGLLLKKRHVENSTEITRQLTTPVRLLLLSLALWIFTSYTVSVLARYYWSRITSIIGIIACTWFLARIAGVVADGLARHSIAKGAREKIAIITLGRRLFTILVVFIALLLLLQGAGINVSAMLAGLGIGGIALALAAQKTLQDLLSGVSIIMSDTIRVGDYCRLADQVGTVEDVGLSNTRLRTLDRTVVSVPNSKISQGSTENFALRDKFWFHHIFSLRCGTSSSQIDQIVGTLSRLLREHPAVEGKTGRINFIGIQQGSFQLEIFAYIKVATNDLFLNTQQQLLFRILAAISEAGSDLALPSQSTYPETGAVTKTKVAAKDQPGND